MVKIYFCSYINLVFTFMFVIIKINQLPPPFITTKSDVLDVSLDMMLWCFIFPFFKYSSFFIGVLTQWSLGILGKILFYTLKYLHKSFNGLPQCVFKMKHQGKNQLLFVREIG